MKPDNLHATALVAGATGLLITGPSGSGKTALALAILDRAASFGRYARLVSDDQVLLCVRGHRLIAKAPDSIAGLVEVRGLGPMKWQAQTEAVIDVAFAIKPAAQVDRMQEPGRFEWGGATTPMFNLPANDTRSALTIVAAWLGWPLLR